jgi:hypothetical protein
MRCMSHVAVNWRATQITKTQALLDCRCRCTTRKCNTSRKKLMLGTQHSVK